MTLFFGEPIDIVHELIQNVSKREDFVSDLNETTERVLIVLERIGRILHHHDSNDKNSTLKRKRDHEVQSDNAFGLQLDDSEDPLIEYAKHTRHRFTLKCQNTEHEFRSIVSKNLNEMRSKIIHIEAQFNRTKEICNTDTKEIDRSTQSNESFDLPEMVRETMSFDLPEMARETMSFVHNMLKRRKKELHTIFSDRERSFLSQERDIMEEITTVWNGDTSDGSFKDIQCFIMGSTSMTQSNMANTYLESLRYIESTRRKIFNALIEI